MSIPLVSFKKTCFYKSIYQVTPVDYFADWESFTNLLHLPQNRTYTMLLADWFACKSVRFLQVSSIKNEILISLKGTKLFEAYSKPISKKHFDWSNFINEISTAT